MQLKIGVYQIISDFLFTGEIFLMMDVYGLRDIFVYLLISFASINLFIMNFFEGLILLGLDSHLDKNATWTKMSLGQNSPWTKVTWTKCHLD